MVRDSGGGAAWGVAPGADFIPGGKSGIAGLAAYSGGDPAFALRKLFNGWELAASISRSSVDGIEAQPAPTQDLREGFAEPRAKPRTGWRGKALNLLARLAGQIFNHPFRQRFH